MPNKKLSDFGFEFQSKLILCLLTDVHFCSRVYDILKSEYFDSVAVEWLIDTILKYYKEYHSMATMAVLKVEMENVEDDLHKQEIIRVLRTAVDFDGATDLQFVKDSTLEFCRIEEMRNALAGSIDLLKESNLEGIKYLVDDALKKGEDKNLGHDYLQQLEDRYADMMRKPVPTGWKYMDDLLQGGLAGGELGAVVGNSGAGKSWVLAYMCTNAMLAGYRALYITLELSKEYVGIRVDCILTGIPMSDLKENKEAIKSKMSRIKGSLHIEWFPNKKLSSVGLRHLLDRFILLEKRPDVIFIDYADLMRLNSSKMKRKDEELQELYEDLRGISGEYEIPIWTASQANRKSHDEGVDFIDASMISESMGKHFTTDFMFSVMRRADDKEKDRGVFHIIKNRLGRDGMTLHAAMNLEEGHIRLFDPEWSRKNKKSEEGDDEPSTPTDRLKQRLDSMYHSEESGGDEGETQ